MRQGRARVSQLRRRVTTLMTLRASGTMHNGCRRFHVFLVEAKLDDFTVNPPSGKVGCSHKEVPKRL